MEYSKKNILSSKKINQYLVSLIGDYEVERL
jgi:hypothetical protein